MHIKTSFFLLTLCSVTIHSTIKTSESKEEAIFPISTPLQKTSHPQLCGTILGDLLATKLSGKVIPKHTVHDLAALVTLTNSPSCNIESVLTRIIDFHKTSPPHVRKAFTKIIIDKKIDKILCTDSRQLLDELTSFAYLCRPSSKESLPTLYRCIKHPA